MLVVDQEDHRHGVRAIPSAWLIARQVCPMSEREENERRFEGLSPTEGERQHEERQQIPNPRGTKTHQRQPDYTGPKALHQRDELDSGTADTFLVEAAWEAFRQLGRNVDRERSDPV